MDTNITVLSAIPAQQQTGAIKTIKDRLAQAARKGVTYPRIVLHGYKFTLAPVTGRNVGAVYVKEKASGAYMGKVLDNKFYPAFDFTAGKPTKVQEILDDFESAVLQHAELFGTCCCCGRTLTNGSSIAAMIGPICAEKYGF